MAENNRNQGNQGDRNQRGTTGDRNSSIGNQQGTTQTGGQSAGGENIDQEEDRYTDDLRRSGDRSSSNTKKESGSNR